MRCGSTSTLLLGTYEEENKHETKVRQQEYEEQHDKGCRQTKGLNSQERMGKVETPGEHR